MRNKLFVLYSFILIILFFSFLISCWDNLSTSTPDIIAANSSDYETETPKHVPRSSSPNIESFEDFTFGYGDSGYKLFFGKWQVSKLIAENIRFGARDIDQMIGVTFFFDWDSVSVNDKEITKNPHFTINIIPFNPQPYIPYMPNQNDIGLTGEYYTYFYVDEMISEYSVGFFIKDDMTLIMEYMEGYYEVNRVLHIPDHEVWYEAL